MMFRILFVSAMLLPFVPGVNAEVACPPGNEALTAITHPQTGALMYVSGEPGVYEESNGFTGLQTAGGACEDDSGRVVEYAADTKVL